MCINPIAVTWNVYIDSRVLWISATLTRRYNPNLNTSVNKWTTWIAGASVSAISSGANLTASGPNRTWSIPVSYGAIVTIDDEQVGALEIINWCASIWLVSPTGNANRCTRADCLLFLGQFDLFHSFRKLETRWHFNQGYIVQGCFIDPRIYFMLNFRDDPVPWTSGVGSCTAHPHYIRVYWILGTMSCG